ncbi:Peptidase-S15 domain-containing protein [Mycena chlorophos]|uniref:Peptidase-S15 domain-containing protein n=1 Tax=Mycena chlorophos TaxID=658473 RepID=A0A8H6TFU9_MYCCL|nr:Peptidase-S15 domain-containing protein [Mycena chlorophos]
MTRLMATLVPLSTGVSLETLISPPPRTRDAKKLAVLLHPWSWLGGRMSDPVLRLLAEPLHDAGYHVVRYNSRGVGNSTGWASLTGQTEAADLAALIQWARDDVGDVRSVLVVGYSYGALIASMQPPLPDIETSYALISYPLSVRGWLTLFRTSSYEDALKRLVQSNSKVLFIFGDQDQFTAVERYRNWRAALGESSVEWVEVKGGSHFWRDEDGDELVARIRVMPLPDERPRASVANLIGRFEGAKGAGAAKPPTSVSPRSTSVASNITGDSAKEEAKTKREWPPRQASTDSKPPPPIVPSSSWTRKASESPAVPASSPPVAAASTVASRISASPQPVVPPHIETQPFSPEPSITVDPATPATPKATPATPVPKATSKPASKAPAAPKSPAKTPAKPAPTPTKSHTPSLSQTLSPAAAARAKAAAAAPKPRASGAHVPARAKTPVKSTTSAASSTRPKTPLGNSGLFAPTASTLARARNSQAGPPPVKMTATEKARMAAAAAANKPIRGKPATRAAPTKAKAPASTRVVKKEAAPKAANVAEIPDEETHEAVEEEVHGEEVHEEEVHEEEVHEEVYEEEGEEVHEETHDAEIAHDQEEHDEQVVEEAHEEAEANGHEEVEAEEHVDDNAADIVSDDSHPSDVSATVVDSKDTAGNDLEEMVHMLEGKTRPLSIASIPDDLDV